MKINFKNIAVPTVSAVIGGVIVFTAIKFIPALNGKIANTKSSSGIMQGNDQIFDHIIEESNIIQNHFNSLFNDDFFVQNDPFSEMKKMRDQMNKRLNQIEGKSTSKTNPFDSWFSEKFGGGTVDDITKREDNNYVYYDIKIEDISSMSINTKVENGQIKITGIQEKHNEESNEAGTDGSINRGYFKSSFSRTFPLPENVNANKLETYPEKNKLILKFPKLKT